LIKIFRPAEVHPLDTTLRLPGSDPAIHHRYLHRAKPTKSDFVRGNLVTFFREALFSIKNSLF
jgi:hypothetical protein